MLLDIQGDMNAIKNTMNELEKLSDEEKAEKYAHRKIAWWADSDFDADMAEGYIKRAYLDGLAEGRKENAGLKAELQNYADVINQLMGTEFTDTEEIGRLIAIAQYRNWGEL